MLTQRYTVTPHPIETPLNWVKSGEIAIPAIQRPPVLEASDGGPARTPGLLGFQRLSLGRLRTAPPRKTPKQ
jgi:hypothetical protein